MTDTKRYAEIATRAEEAVASIKDVELRKLAFQKILEDLLHGGGAPNQTSRGSAAKTMTQAAAKSAPPKRPRSGTQSYIDEVLEDSFFKQPRSISELKVELENRGHHVPLTSLSGPLQRMCKRRVLRRQKTKAPDNQQVFRYSNW